MTLSNFDWTDKDSVKWFILMPNGHVGPYSLKMLTKLYEQKKVDGNLKIWAEGLAVPVMMKNALNGPHPQEDELPPPVPIEIETESPNVSTKIKTYKPWLFISGAMIIMIFFGSNGFVGKYERFDIPRLSKMTLNMHQRILKEFSFDGWDKKIFFKEFLSDDHTHIWLVTSGFQHCSVEAQFQSIDDKMLSTKSEQVRFKSKSILSNHIVEFSTFEFLKGSKIIPGMYELDIRANQCQWDSFLAKLMNGYSGPEEEYVARTKVILFSKGPIEFNSVLDKLILKKAEIDLKLQSQNALFWQDLQQKLETLQAITLQIEQQVLDVLNNDPKTFKTNLKLMINQYTKQFGSFLTTFVIENENYFKNLNSESSGFAQRRNYEMIVKLTAKQIGFESMKYIEEFQAFKHNPTQKDLDKISDRVRKTYAQIKNDINGKLIQVSEDRLK